MPYDPFKYHRRTIRLKDYDYASAGAYFVTVCLQGPNCLFGDIHEGELQLNAAGEMIGREWLALARRFPSIELDTFVVMPNHFHGVVFIHKYPRVGAGLVPARSTNEQTPSALPRPTLGHIVGSFKSITTNAYSQGVRAQGWPTFYGRLWQRNYYEHIIRNDRALAAIRQYIHDNPANWNQDRLHPDG